MLNLGQDSILEQIHSFISLYQTIHFIIITMVCNIQQLFPKITANCLVLILVNLGNIFVRNLEMVSFIFGHIFTNLRLCCLSREVCTTFQRGLPRSLSHFSVCQSVSQSVCKFLWQCDWLRHQFLAVVLVSQSKVSAFYHMAKQHCRGASAQTTDEITVQSCVQYCPLYSPHSISGNDVFQTLNSMGIMDKQD